MAMTQADSQTVSVSFSSVFGFMDTVHELTNQVLKLAGFGEDDRYWLTIAIREAVTNAVKHGNRQEASKLVALWFTLRGDELEIGVRDSGVGFDFSSVPDPTKPENLLLPKGRGIYYMRKFMDEVRYDSGSGRGTTVIMIKKLHGGERPG